MGRLAVIAAAGLLSLGAPALGETPTLLVGALLAPVAPAPPALPALVPPPPPVLTDAQAGQEAGRIATALRAEVPAAVVTSVWRRQRMVELARAALDQAGRMITRPQLLVVVDRNPSVQLMQLVLALPDGPWSAIGGTRVSTGQSGRKFYYITPTGVFENSDAILGYRAQGTFNEHHIRGNGLKGMRVWDFGWHDAVKGWRADRETGAIRLEVHATDPEFLERRLGRPASEGCIRIPAAMNRFLDVHGVLDVDDERAAAVDIRFRALLLPDRRQTPLAGKLLVVVDSADAAKA
jgi:hypothetical protein